MKFETLAIRIQTALTSEKEHSTPMFPTSSFVFEDAEQMRAVFADEEEGNIYSRFTNPNCTEFENKIAITINTIGIQINFNISFWFANFAMPINATINKIMPNKTNVRRVPMVGIVIKVGMNVPINEPNVEVA